MPSLLKGIGLRAAAFWRRDYGSYLTTLADSTKRITLGGISNHRGGSQRRVILEGAICQGKSDNSVALTFDDGPHPGVTERILDTLQQYHARATFFLIGNKIELAPEVIKRAIAEGHRLGNHSFNHPRLPKIKPTELLQEIRQTQQKLVELLGKQSRWFRPPYGSLCCRQERYVVGEGLQIAYWSVNSKDWQHPGARVIADKVIREMKPGSVVVLHDVHEQTVEALPMILDEIGRRGWKAVTLSDMFPRASLDFS